MTLLFLYSTFKLIGGLSPTNYPLPASNSDSNVPSLEFLKSSFLSGLHPKLNAGRSRWRTQLLLSQKESFPTWKLPEFRNSRDAKQHNSPFFLLPKCTKAIFRISCGRIHTWRKGHPTQKPSRPRLSVWLVNRGTWQKKQLQQTGDLTVGPWRMKVAGKEDSSAVGMK